MGAFSVKCQEGKTAIVFDIVLMGPLSFLILYAHVLCRAWYMRRVDGGEVYKPVMILQSTFLD